MPQASFGKRYVVYGTANGFTSYGIGSSITVAMERCAGKIARNNFASLKENQGYLLAKFTLSERPHAFKPQLISAGFKYTNPDVCDVCREIH